MFFQGSKPIDGIWATKDRFVTHTCVLLAGFGIGNHQMFVVDLQEDTIIGTAPFRVKQFIPCRLNTKVSSGATQKYIQKFEESLLCHRMIEKLDEIHLKYQSTTQFQMELSKLDKQSKDLMIKVEKKWR